MYWINTFGNYYKEMTLLIEGNDFVSLIMQIFSFILTLITFLTVTMSVQYQEYIYKAKEILFDIKNSENKGDIKRYIEKLGYIDEERCNYNKCINIFVGISYAILMIVVLIAPIYYVDANIVMILLIAMSLIMFDFSIYLVYKRLNRDKNAFTKNDVLNAKNYMKCYNKNINIFPKVVFNKFGFCVIDTDIYMRNYSVIVKLQYDLKDQSVIVFRRNDKEIDENEKIYNKNFKIERDVKEIYYYININQDWIEYKIDKECNSDNELKIIPTNKKEKFSVDMIVRNCLNSAKINEITIF